MRRKHYLISNGYLQRLNDAYLLSGLNAVELGKIIHRNRKAVYKYMDGDTTPDVLTLARLCVALNISADWLLFGKEDK